MKQYKKVADVDDKYKFDLEAILENKTFEQLLDELKTLNEHLIAIKDSKYDTVEAYAASFELAARAGVLSNRLYNYVSNHLNRELTSSLYRSYEVKLNQLSEEFNQKFGSEQVRFFQNVEKLKQWVNHPVLAPYKKIIESELENYEHKLDDKVEEYLTQIQTGEPNLEDIFTVLSDSETDYGTVVNAKGKKLPLNHATRLKYLKSADGELRKNTVLAWNRAIFKHKDTLANLLFQQFRSLNVEAKTRKYKSAINMLTNADKVDDDLLQILFSKISSLNSLIAKYRRAHKKFYESAFGEKYNQKYDSARELVKVKSNYSVEEMQALVLEALKPFGEEYYNVVSKAIYDRWVDYMTIENKVSGAYSIGGHFGIDKKYILMNFDGQFGSVETLAHELGHSMHSYFSDQNNDFYNSQYPIFLAEIASIFNEEMLYDHVLKATQSDKLKFQLLEERIRGWIGTVQRQIIWANYEYNLYQGIEQYKVNPTYESISTLYFENLKRYTEKPKQLKYEPEFLVASVDVPHFYYGFYVYKYAIGQLVASYFFHNYKLKGETYLQYYIDNFLKQGGNDYPLEILKKVGVDLKSDAFYEIGFQHFEQMINEYIKLGEKLFSKPKRPRKKE
ncbi:M3 family oligoendopeptidase [Mycoplasmopsis columbinasalis]|uniref:Oligoendopeptidase F, plasmid n=1 Tax=Mycoplasmopsis columbinasalis TaxID=114880 RepID=A0A449BAS9_9BACT|nr:M3 family oligoendopeptidase [Mycoplasmopsis columbinasalis]VEU78313.1 Oligoendopeptidase F, plasmid [Mycoplasmopsis columbinasalis]